MARMIPSNGPVDNDSRIAEPSIYYELAHQLSDEFTVICFLQGKSASTTIAQAHISVSIFMPAKI